MLNQSINQFILETLRSIQISYYWQCISEHGLRIGTKEKKIKEKSLEKDAEKAQKERNRNKNKEEKGNRSYP